MFSTAIRRSLTARDMMYRSVTDFTVFASPITTITTTFPTIPKTIIRMYKVMKAMVTDWGNGSGHDEDELTFDEFEIFIGMEKFHKLKQHKYCREKSKGKASVEG
ncbi:hypothetical protein CHS0354_028375 [Potamilus streckersoni]|uniref:Uncharacterized protein n=1 Tax=Potamilus streckersoni TaxID=2493646 RepID=A0AAE0VJW2_9BIVA|nr:hypothetical protein CHS0354_028375 [Potamilus streckersoni]